MIRCTILLGLLAPLHCLARLLGPDSARSLLKHSIETPISGKDLRYYQLGHAKVLAGWAATNLVVGGTSMFLSQGKVQ